MDDRGSGTVNTGPASKQEGADEFDITGNVKRKGEDPSPDNRDRGEVSEKDRSKSTDR